MIASPVYMHVLLSLSPLARMRSEGYRSLMATLLFFCLLPRWRRHRSVLRQERDTYSIGVSPRLFSVIIFVDFRKNLPLKSYGVKKANMLISICLPRHHIMLPMQRHFATIGPFLVLSKSNNRLPATWNSKAASYSSQRLYSIAVTCSFTVCACVFSASTAK